MRGGGGRGDRAESRKRKRVVVKDERDRERERNDSTLSYQSQVQSHTDILDGTDNLHNAGGNTGTSASSGPTVTPMNGSIMVPSTSNQRTAPPHPQPPPVELPVEHEKV